MLLPPVCMQQQTLAPLLIGSKAKLSSALMRTVVFCLFLFVFCLSVCLFVSLSVCLFVCLSVCLFGCLAVWPSAPSSFSSLFSFLCSPSALLCALLWSLSLSLSLFLLFLLVLPLLCCFPLPVSALFLSALFLFFAVFLCACLLALLLFCCFLGLSLCSVVFLCSVALFPASVCSVCLSVCLFVCLSVCLLVCLSVCLFVCLSVWLFGCLAVCLLVCLSVCLFVCLLCFSPSCFALLRKQKDGLLAMIQERTYLSRIGRSSLRSRTKQDQG